ncbi:hypothetical protein LV89_03209 [Arcicella aurantiaca]|jgi:hypothetical protein|uniref:Uncharacterized protein n=1 Tax=Arcicella aurantiaca TaxID=591202 RepID=A0A316E2H4_9BACT|nr:hypothetical protein [Arcicella aurantiaca]PWK22943.1 hypothetical protein LV89_03209 [Arcicella aurantiaca]
MKQHRAIFQQNNWREFQRKRNVRPLSTRKEKESINPEFDRASFDWIN